MESVLTSMAIQILAPIAVSVASALIIWGLGEAARWVRTKTNNAQVINAMDRLTCTAATTVAELEQALVPALKAQAQDGKLTARERSQLQRLALDKIKARLTPAIQKQAGLAIADLDSFLQAKIEQSVLELKARAPDVVNIKNLNPEALLESMLLRVQRENGEVLRNALQ